MAAVMAVARESVVQGAAADAAAVAAAAAWTPDLTALSHVVAMLHQSTSGSNDVQDSLYKQLESYATNSDFNNYLAHVLARGVSQDTAPPNADLARVRQLAGILLKNNVRFLYRALPRERQVYINGELLRAAADDLRLVRTSAALCISAIVERCSLTVWPELVQWVLSALESGDENLVDGGLTILCRLAEDLAHVLEQADASLDAVVRPVIALCGHKDSSKRAMALQIVNHFVVLMPPVMYSCVELYCRALFDIAEDTSVDVRKRVCTAICLLLQSVPDALAKYMPNIIQYMLQSSKHSDEQVALEAAEFWIIAAELKDARRYLTDFVPQIVEMLIDNMVFNESDRALFDAAVAEDDMLPDRPEDIRPRFHQPRLREFTKSGSPPDGNSRIDDFGTGGGSAAFSEEQTRSTIDGQAFDSGGASKLAMNQTTYDNRINPRSVSGSSSDDDDDVDDDGQWDGSSEWSVRKCTATALDSLSFIFCDEVLAAVLPRLNEKLRNERWELRECAVLVLGAIANGCYSGMEPQLPHIFPFLMHLLADPHYMVRCVSCWTLARYSRWVVHRRDDARFEGVLAGLLHALNDRNKTVQKAACSALAAFEEEAGPGLGRYVKHILQTIAPAFSRYQAKNLVVLYDTVCTLADAVGTELGDAEHLNLLMPPLIAKWNSLADTDEAILPLLECLSCVFRAIGTPANQFAPNVLARCVNIVDAVYKMEASGEKSPVHVEFLTCALDLMCGLAEAIGPGIDPLVANSTNGAQPLLPLLFVAMRDARQEVRQSAFALVGEFARARLPALIPALHEYVQCIIGALNPEYMSVSNNATWALGEMVMMAGFLPASVPIHRDAIKRALVDGALDPLVRVVNMPQLNKSLLENTAITLGRMGLVIPDAMAPRLASFARATFTALRDIRDDAEKEQAAHGMNALVKANPTAIFDCFVYYVDAIASWYHCKADLEADFASILSGYKMSMGEQWYALFRSFPPTLQTLLKERFKL